jgi:hypothetical protein
MLRNVLRFLRHGSSPVGRSVEERMSTGGKAVAGGGGSVFERRQIEHKKFKRWDNQHMIFAKGKKNSKISKT